MQPRIALKDGDEFDALYERYECIRRMIKAQELCYKNLESSSDTRYGMFSDPPCMLLI